jgi:methionine biosynthesis protein MetW
MKDESMDFDSIESNDNRSYSYRGFEHIDRDEYRIIIDYIDAGSKVIDLGCGNGVLLQQLINQKNINGCGIEISEDAVSICKEKGLNVTSGRIDERLPFNDNEFDYAVCNVTLQMVMYPEILIREMKRISKYQIISFPNFGFWKNRIDLLINGKMPSKTLFGYSWYTTGHLHQLSINDFTEFITSIGGLQILDRKFADNVDFLRMKLADLFPNLFHLLPVYLLKKTI